MSLPSFVRLSGSGLWGRWHQTHPTDMTPVVYVPASHLRMAATALEAARDELLGRGQHGGESARHKVEAALENIRRLGF